jgi:DNA-binding FadR family transcriptional regulator
MALGENLNLTVKVVEALGSAIVSGVYEARGSLPIEGELFKQHNTSRGTLREAVKMLTAKGLIGSRPRQGTWVEAEDNWNWLDPDVLRWAHRRALSLDLMRELTEFRLMIEPPAAALAARMPSRQSMDVIKSALNRLAAAEIGEDDALEAELMFHVALIRAGCNRFVGQFSGVTELAIRSSFRLANRLKLIRPTRVAEHARIFHAIVAQDTWAAETAAREMIQDSMALIEQAEAESRTGNRAPIAVASSQASG